ncbi:hypothetical protein [Georgenia sp. Z1491]|uniref:hypothetical protein n=1 Tax=Georgenia sp. Z1491 TaxID=3416707 RepID=UPI003CE9C2A2
MPTPASLVADLVLEQVGSRDDGDAPAGTPARDRRTVVLGIDGRSGAGKSTLASDVVTILERRSPYRGRVALVRLDDHYQGWTGLRAGAEAVRPVLAALGRGEAGSAPTWDWHRSAPGPVRVVPAPGRPHPRLVVVEGCGATLLHDHLDALAWLDEPEAMRRARAEAREGDVSSWWKTWARQEDEALALAAPYRYADLRLTASE